MNAVKKLRYNEDREITIDLARWGGGCYKRPCQEQCLTETDLGENGKYGYNDYRKLQEILL